MVFLGAPGQVNRPSFDEQMPVWRRNINATLLYLLI